MKKTVEFTETRTVEDAAGNVVATFEAGKKYELEAESADRWIRREVAFDTKLAKKAEPEPTTGESSEKPVKAK